MPNSESESSQQMFLDEIWRFPVKGFAGEQLQHIDAIAGQLLGMQTDYAKYG